MFENMCANNYLKFIISEVLFFYHASLKFVKTVLKCLAHVLIYECLILSNREN